MFGANAGSIYSAQYPGVEAGQTMQAQTGGIQAGLQQEEANNILNVGNYNASMETLSAKNSIANAAENYNAGGVFISGSPLAQLNQMRQLGTLQVGQIQQQAGLQAQMENTAANAGINATRSQLLGIGNQYTAGLANADIQQEDVLPKDLGAIAGLIGSGLGSAIGNMIGGSSATDPTSSYDPATNIQTFTGGS